MKKEKKKKGSLGIGKMFLLLLLSGVFFFSAFQIISILREDQKSEEAYSNLREEANKQTGGESEDDQLVTGQESQDPSEDKTKDTDPKDDKEDANQKDGDKKKRTSSVDIAALQKSYPEIKGWIMAEAMGIDYPVMQADNNEYYLDHLFDGSPNASGSLFVDYRNSGILTDDNTVIYGHNMDNGAMFAHLNQYKSQEFYEKNPTMTITTQDGDYSLELIGGTVEDGDYQFVKLDFEDFEDMEKYVADIRERSTFQSPVKIKEGDRLISLCTCTYESKNARYMLVGVVR